MTAASDGVGEFLVGGVGLEGLGERVADPGAAPPPGWHPDYAHTHPPTPLFGVKLFAFLADVRPRSGGTLVIPGSHRVVARFARSLPPAAYRDGKRFLPLLLGHDDWFRSLSRRGAGGGADRPPGDVVLTHPWVLRCPAPNAGAYPRMMLTKNLYRRGAVRRDQP
jgi:ectoine hydroxylase-related dioxygenase (phytanoyl-CoA dioxygenase family)